MQWIVFCSSENIPEWNKRNRWISVHTAHPQGERSEAGKCSHGVDWWQKGLCYGLANLDNRIYKNVQDIQQSYKFHHERYTFANTLCNDYDATQFHTLEVVDSNSQNHQKRLLIYIAEIKRYVKTEKELKTDSNNEKIQLDIGIEFGWEKCINSIIFTPIK